MSDEYNPDKIKLNNIIKLIKEDKSNLFNNICNLIDSGFNVNTQNENGDTLLHVLIKNFKEEIIIRLIDFYDFDLNLKNKENETVLDYAYDEIYMNFNLIIKLLNKGCKIDPRIYEWRKEFMVYVRELIIRGYKHDFYDSNNNTILHYIISSKSIYNQNKFNYFKQLVEHNQDYSIKNKDNETPIDLARKYDYQDIINFIIDIEYKKILNIIENNNIYIDQNLIKNLVTFLI